MERWLNIWWLKDSRKIRDAKRILHWKWTTKQVNCSETHYPRLHQWNSKICQTSSGIQARRTNSPANSVNRSARIKDLKLRAPLRNKHEEKVNRKRKIIGWWIFCRRKALSIRGLRRCSPINDSRRLNRHRLRKETTQHYGNKINEETNKVCLKKRR